MSLPSYVIFYDDQGNELSRAFINVGWSFGPNWQRQVFKEIEDIPTDFATVEMYEHTYTKQEMVDFLMQV